MEAYWQAAKKKKKDHSRWNVINTCMDTHLLYDENFECLTLKSFLGVCISRCQSPTNF